MKRLVVISLCLLACLGGLLQSQVRSGPRLTITTNLLSGYVLQPASGIWNPLTRTLEPYGWEQVSGPASLYCGETVAVYWLSATGHLYECQASDTWGQWLGSQMQIAGTGGLVTQYDQPHPHRLYRVKETP